jgi:hypothetical protein
VVPSSSSNDNLSLVKHDTWVDLNPGGMRILYTQESALVPDSPLPSPSCYIVSRQRVGAGYNKVLIPNTDYKGKGHTESAPSNLTPRVKRHHPLPKIRGPPGMMGFTNDDMEEEKEELSIELVASRKQIITALEEQVAELHLTVYDQQDEFGVLCKATTSKLKCLSSVFFTKPPQAS